MTPKQFKAFLARESKSAYEAADPLGVTKRQAQRYAAGHNIPRPVAKLCHAIINKLLTWRQIEELDEGGK